MRLRVLKKFSDKYTNQVYEIGDIIEVNEARGWEIASNPIELAEIIKEVIDVTDAIKNDEPADVEPKPKTTRKKKTVKKSE